GYDFRRGSQLLQMSPPLTENPGIRANPGFDIIQEIIQRQLKRQTAKRSDMSGIAVNLRNPKAATQSALGIRGSGLVRLAFQKEQPGRRTVIVLNAFRLPQTRNIAIGYRIQLSLPESHAMAVLQKLVDASG